MGVGISGILAITEDVLWSNSVLRWRERERLSFRTIITDIKQNALEKL